MPRWIVVAGAVAAAGLAGAAFAGADTSTVPFGITVNGSASETVAAGTTAAQLQRDYLDELAAALSAAEAKAVFVAGREGETLGSLYGVVENSDVPTQVCTVGPIEAATPGAATGTAKHKSKKKRKPAPHKTAPRKAPAVLVGGGCEVSASVTATYGFGPAPVTGPSGPTGASGPSGPSGPTG